MQQIPSFVSGGLLAAMITAAPTIETPPTAELPPVKTVSVYTCDTLPPQTAEAWQQPELHELRETCAATEQALALVRQWEADPTADIVYEPAGD